MVLKVDLDLGNYERFLDIKLTRDNNITTGKIYQVNELSISLFKYILYILLQAMPILAYYFILFILNVYSRLLKRRDEVTILERLSRYA